MTIAVHATCTAQAFRPELTESIVNLGSRLGFDLSVPKAQTCCGLTAWDAGQVRAAQKAARLMLQVFGSYDQVVTASPACLRMFRQHIPQILADQPDAVDAKLLAKRVDTWEHYVAKHVDLDQLDLHFKGRIAYFRPCRHDNDEAARIILTHIKEATILPDPVSQCCGYANSLIWRHPELSRAIVTPVVTALRLSQAELVLTSDLACLLQLQPTLQRTTGIPILHVAEFIAQNRQ